MRWITLSICVLLAAASLAWVVVEYAGVDAGRGKAGDTAADDLFKVEHPAIGQVAPDLEGEDLEGTVFKLSDYRGKVVLLDFWAHW